MPPYVTTPSNRTWHLGTHSHLHVITEKLNEIRDEFLKTDATHLGIADADVEWPPDALYTLLKMDVDVASGIYPQHNDRNTVIAGVIHDTGKYNFASGDIEQLRGRVLGEKEWVGAGNGCMVIKRRVFKQYSPHYPIMGFDSTGGRGSDAYFWWTAQKIGFKCRLNGNIVCGHLPEHPLAEMT